MDSVCIKRYLVVIVNCLIIFYLFFISRSFFRTSELRPLYYATFFVKILYGMAYALLYTYYYTAEDDSICYHHDGIVFDWYFWHEPSRFFKVLFFSDFECPEQGLEFWMHSMERSFFMSKLISVLYIVLTKNYWLITIYTSMINFMASYYFANEVVRKYPTLKYTVVLAFLCMPSVQIWTSGLLKESYGLACIYICLGMYLHDGLKTVYKLLIGLVCVWILYKIKVYYLTFLPFVAFHYLYKNYNLRLAGIIVVLSLSAVLVFVHYRWVEIVHVLLYSRDVSYYMHTHALANLNIGEVTTNVWTLLEQAPQVIFKACFEPRYLLGVPHLKVLVGLSNIGVLTAACISLTMAVLYRYKLSIEAYMLLGYIMVSAFLIGLTVPNLGALVRLRVFYEPFLIFLAFLGPGRWLYTLFRKQSTDAKSGDS